LAVCSVDDDIHNLAFLGTMRDQRCRDQCRHCQD
jgi:hypothetical protein